MHFIAHSKNVEGVEHSLADHSRNVAGIMENFSISKKYRIIFRLTGLLHDLGKYQMAFQKYLRNGGRRGSVPHASWGAAFASKYRKNEAAFVIDGHHKGLPDLADLQDDLADFNVDDHILYTSIKEDFLKDSQLIEDDLSNNSYVVDQTEREVFIRYLFSSLTDADWLDTEKHFNKEVSEKRVVPEFNANLLIAKLEEEIKTKSKVGNINRLRNSVRDYAISKASGEIGFYSMTLPTGMGKTLTSMNWALHHARHNGLKRIIVVLPFISIIDQTAQELKRIFDEEWVLEHHSNFTEDEETNQEIASENISTEAYAKRLATENWDYPVIITTSVQFFESLFSNKPSRCRKVHNIARSVVVFDEVQTLPKELVLPTLAMLRDVAKIMDTSFLFCTATQPAFEKRERFNGIENITSLVENPEEIFKVTKRVTYSPINQYRPVSILDLVNLVLDKDTSTLIIFNTKKQVISFYKEINEKTDSKTFHLSTSMYPTHRKRMIDTIRQSLKNQDKIIVSSTQLIEAGVDFDFPCVLREIAPLESIIQSAGRCNREDKLDKPGEVFIFSLKERPKAMKQYYSLGDFANTLYKDNEEVLFEPDFFKEYYKKALDLLVEPDKLKIEDDRAHYRFKTIAEKYKLIENDTTPLFILCDESSDLYERIRNKPILSRLDCRAMQQYSVQVYDNFIRDNIEKLGREPQGYWIWHGEYNTEYGISTDNPVHIF